MERSTKMYIYEKYDYSLFESRFKDYGRLNQFPKGLRDLFEYLESLAKDTGKSIELDVIGLCCEFTEDTIENVLKEYDLESLDDLTQETLVIDVDDETIIYQSY